MSEEPRDRGLGSKAPEFIRSNPILHRSWQVAVFLVGLAVAAGGVVLLPLPGPGWVVIFAGLGIWATEFVWAQLFLRWARRKVAKAARHALDPRVRRRNIILTSVGVAVVIALVGVYVRWFGWRAPWRLAQ
jgi:uncharacterized protein (TIGR02611 family)